MLWFSKIFKAIEVIGVIIAAVKTFFAISRKKKKDQKVKDAIKKHELSEEERFQMWADIDARLNSRAPKHGMHDRPTDETTKQQ